MFVRKYWLPFSVLIVSIAGVSLYLLTIQTQPPQDPIVIIKPVEPLPKSTAQASSEAPVGDTSQGGHFHEDGTFHAEPHDATVVAEVSEAEVSADVPGAFVDAQQSDTQIDAPGQDSSTPSQDAGDVNSAWLKWSKRHNELAKKFLQAAREDTALLPTTKEEQERFDNDPEWQRRYSEALHKTAKIYGMMKAHDNENPLLQ